MNDRLFVCPIGCVDGGRCIKLTVFALIDRYGHAEGIFGRTILSGFGKIGFDRIMEFSGSGKINIEMSGPAVVDADGISRRQGTVDFGNHISCSAALNHNGHISAGRFCRKRRPGEAEQKEQ